MAWEDYDPELLDQFAGDVVIICKTQGNHSIFLARTFPDDDDHYIPGYAVNGVGYFVSKERKPFQTDDFQVLVDTEVEFVEFSQYVEFGLVADDEVDESERIKIGCFEIEEVRYCGMVDKQNNCYINFDSRVYCKKEPEFQIPVDSTSYSDEFYSTGSGDEHYYLDFFKCDIQGGLRWVQDICAIHERPGEVFLLPRPLLHHDSSIEQDGSIKHADTMPTQTWLNYQHAPYLPANTSDVVLCNSILVARTFHEGFYVPGFAVGGIGYFVSKEREPFQTRNFQVLDDTNTRWVGYAGNHENGMVAFDSIDASKRIKIGSFIINGMRLFGLVDDQNKCYINLYGQIRSKDAPEFQVLVEPSIRRDNLTDNNRPIVLVARTLHEGNWVPGYAINGVGYFVSKELQPFQTTNFQVLIDTFIEFKEFRGNYENVIVADDGVEESKRIKIGSFFINDMRFCGMVDNQNTCYINFNGQIHAKNAPKYQVIVEITPNRLRFRRYRF
ncbi:Hypothetical predicted protein [Cloeon dipterum]|uniref:Uncharacterized protein n=1 Tax=Cloeon dipterum TaxID=197152 RepID=A0A8S1DT00_9INSE|nr:Hypothetical predicted protein [Cloeon dipterum]